MAASIENFTKTCLFLCFLWKLSASDNGMLYPRLSETRSIIHLDGIWKFRADMSKSRQEGFDKEWYTKPLKQTGEVLPMPVPASFNDITQNKTLRDFVGWVWYETEFFIPKEWMNKRVVLRFGSAHYITYVWVNSKQVTSHIGGHLPFEVRLRSNFTYYSDRVNRLTVAINNTLTPETLPPGEITYHTDTNRYPPGYFTQDFTFDFFNYAGIHRSVKLYTTPTVYIDDITIVTNLSGTDGIVDFKIVQRGPQTVGRVIIEVLDVDGTTVSTNNNLQGRIVIPKVHPWWPVGMGQNSTAYLYTFQVTLKSGTESDVYRLPFGVRTVKVTDTQLLINDKPFYCHGVAKHEDSDIRGKGLDFSLIAKDFNLLKWLGANCIRTSHYPYAEEFMDQCDQQGIAVIDESPAVGIHSAANYGNMSLAHHLNVMLEMVQRDKNRPAVIIWSVANEPQIMIPEAEPYFKRIIAHTKMLDPTRPVTFVAAAEPYGDYATKFVDILCINKYFAWYSDCGHTELIQQQLKYELNLFHKRLNKPIIVTEYGADTVVGLHQDPSFVFTEEYQVDFLTEYHKGFDNLRKTFLVGEMVWNFADFMTKQDITRVVGNRKGLFTRQRQPKMSAHLIKRRYESLLSKTC